MQRIKGKSSYSRSRSEDDTLICVVERGRGCETNGT